MNKQKRKSMINFLKTGRQLIANKICIKVKILARLTPLESKLVRSVLRTIKKYKSSQIRIILQKYKMFSIISKTIALAIAAFGASGLSNFSEFFE